MADVKWIKIAVDMFDNRKIKQIGSMPEGDSLLLMWVQLLCLAGNVNDGGFIYLTKEIPYTDEMLATQFNKPISTVRLALKTFKLCPFVKTNLKEKKRILPAKKISASKTLILQRICFCFYILIVFIRRKLC